jgi:hypothetical protein
MDLSNILSTLLSPSPGSDVAHAPAPDAGLLPALPMGGPAPLPQAPAGTVPMGMPQGAAPQQGGGKLDMIRDLAPLLISAVTGARNPIHGAAIAQGSYMGAHQAMQENLDAEQRDQQKRALGARFMQQTAADVLQLKDPHDRQNYLQLADEIGTSQFNLPQGWTKKIPAHDAGTDVFAGLKAELAGKLKAFDADKRWASVAGTPGEAKISFQLSNGQSVPVNTARQLVGQAVYDSTGAQAFAPDTPDGKTVQERLANLQAGARAARARGDIATATKLEAQYADELKVKRDMEKPASDAKVGTFEDYVTRKYGPDPTPQQVEAARRSWGDEGRAAPINITLPDMPGMSAKERVESAAQDILNNRMAPSQLATFFTGMGKESASQLRSLVMQRVKQMQPDFNFAAAEANYQYGKNVGVQSSLRFSKSVQESIPMLIAQAQKLGNGNIRSINALINAGKSQFNDVDLKRFKTTATLVADEIAKILQGGGTGAGTSDAKLRQAGEILNTSDSPQAIAAALSDVSDLIGFRTKAQKEGTFMEQAPPASKATLRYNPITGRVEPVKK